MALGTLGIWRRHPDGMGPIAELESLGYGTLWLGASPSLEQTRPWLEATQKRVEITPRWSIYRLVPPPPTAP